MHRAFQEVAGLVQFTPATATDNAGVTLRVPYYLVPRAKADINTKLGKLEGTNPSATADVTNKKASSPAMQTSTRGASKARTTRARSRTTSALSACSRSGSQRDRSQPCADRLRRQHATTAGRMLRSTSSTSAWTWICDGVDDYVVVGIDQGAVQTGAFNGIMGSFVFSTRSAGASIAFLADAATDGSTALLPVCSSQLCRTGEPCLSKTGNPDSRTTRSASTSTSRSVPAWFQAWRGSTSGTTPSARAVSRPLRRGPRTRAT